MIDFCLEKWQPAHAENLSIHANNKNIADYLRDVFPFPYTLKDAQCFIESMMQSDEQTQYCRAIVVDEVAVGSIGVFLKTDVYRKSAELGYWLSEFFWRKGIVTAAICKICDIAFSSYDIVRIFAEPYAHNIASRRVLEKSGFTLEGILKKSVYKNDSFFDSCIYAITK